jgi:glycerol-3-phosphate dehydrogenase (NAD(P)+)
MRNFDAAVFGVVLWSSGCSLGSAASATLLPVRSCSRSARSPLFVISVFLAVFVFWTHRTNIQRLPPDRSISSETKTGRSGPTRSCRSRWSSRPRCHRGEFVMRAAVVGAGAWERRSRVAGIERPRHHDLGSRDRRRGDPFTGPRFPQGFTLAPSLRARRAADRARRAEFLVCDAVTIEAHRRPGRVRRTRRGAVSRHERIERGTLALMTSVVGDEVPGRPVVGVSGPSFASEVAAGQPTAIVAASVVPDAARVAQDALSSRTFRVYTNDDVIGVELGGALKNVMAIATGIVEGVGLGNNSRAALITRGLHEMTRLGVALGARAITFAGLAGIGDLVLTCTGLLSRNHALGLEIGRGATLEEALAGKETVAEGVASTASGLALAERCGVDMPIVQMVHRILFDGHTARQAVPELMARELRSEQDL